MATEAQKLRHEAARLRRKAADPEKYRLAALRAVQKYQAANREKVRAAEKLYRRQNAERVQTAKKDYRRAHLAEIKAYEKAYKKDNADRIRAAQKVRRAENPAKHQGFWRKWKYGLSPEQHATMIAEQGGLCAICKQERPLCVDHDHNTGRVRALLCRGCNTNLAWLESPRLVAKLFEMREYLRKHGSMP